MFVPAARAADQRRRGKNRVEGRESDDGNEWERHSAPAADVTDEFRHWPAPASPREQLMLPTQPYPTRKAIPGIPDRSGLFGYFGDIRDVRGANRKSNNHK